MISTRLTSTLFLYLLGVPALPPPYLRFAHASYSFFYLYHGRMYRTPPSEREHGIFTVEPFKTSSIPNLNNPNSDTTDSPGPSRSTISLQHLKYPLGGHNYYNNRDMEKLSRRMRWVEVITAGEGTLEEKWEKYYLRRLASETRKLEGTESLLSHIGAQLKVKKIKRN